MKTKSAATVINTFALAFLVLAGWLTTHPAKAASPYSNAQLIDGFNRTVFGSEYTDLFAQSYVRKFNGEVRFYVHSLADSASEMQTRMFIESLPKLIDGMEAKLVDSRSEANFVVHIVRRRDYERIVRRDVYRNPNEIVRGRCLVRSVYTRNGISRSDAVIVADEGPSLFSRCMTEEILQGLGPLNDDRRLRFSMFNDTSRFTSFRRFDRFILNMLYDRRIKPGMSRSAANKLLPTVLRSVRRTIEGS